MHGPLLFSWKESGRHASREAHPRSLRARCEDRYDFLCAEVSSLRFLEYGFWCKFLCTDNSSCCHAVTARLSSTPYSSAVHIWLTVKSMASLSPTGVAPVQRHRDTFMLWSR